MPNVPGNVWSIDNGFATACVDSTMSWSAYAKKSRFERMRLLKDQFIFKVVFRHLRLHPNMNEIHMHLEFRKLNSASRASRMRLSQTLCRIPFPSSFLEENQRVILVGEGDSVVHHLLTVVQLIDCHTAMCILRSLNLPQKVVSHAHKALLMSFFAMTDIRRSPSAGHSVSNHSVVNKASSNDMLENHSPVRTMDLREEYANEVREMIEVEQELRGRLKSLRISGVRDNGWSFHVSRDAAGAHHHAHTPECDDHISVGNDIIISTIPNNTNTDIIFEVMLPRTRSFTSFYDQAVQFEYATQLVDFLSRFFP